MNIIKLFIFPILFMMLLFSCKEEMNQQLNNDDTIPSVVKNVKVDNLSGEVRLSYDIPKGTSVLYVEAEVEMKEGKIIKAKSSYYNNFLEIEGFGEAKEYEVKLYSVGRNLKRSDPIIIKVNPLDPPVANIFESLTVVEDFGGMSIGFQNDDEAEVSLVVEQKDSIGDWVAVQTFYTKQKEGVLTVRGLEAKLQSFRIYLNDRWDNRSGLLEIELLPLYEVELDKANFKSHPLVNDPLHFGANRVHFLWNNNFTGSASGSGGWYRTANGTVMPTQIAIDLGVTAKLSRFKFWQRGTISETNLLYTAGTPRLFEIWGSNNPNPDGSYDSWVKLMDGELIKPSGQPIPTNSPVDLEIAVAGHEFTFPLDIQPMRYIRIKVIRTYGVTDYFWMGEVSFFGQLNNLN